jgi:hypothetical protein
MRSGHFYRHDYAQDIYIDVKKTFEIKPGVWKIKCDIYSYWLNCRLATTTFRLDSEHRSKWTLFVPVTK